MSLKGAYMCLNTWNPDDLRRILLTLRTWANWGRHSTTNDEWDAILLCLQTQLNGKVDTDKQDWRDTIDLSEEYAAYRAEFITMLEPFPAMWDGHLDLITIATHCIKLDPSNCWPVHAAPYRAGPKTYAVEKDEIDNMLRMNIIEPAQTEWESPVVIATKKEGTLRFCDKFRKLNFDTMRDSYPLLRVKECIDSLADARIFSTLDANSGYWQIEVGPADREKTTFTLRQWTLRLQTVHRTITGSTLSFPLSSTSSISANQNRLQT